VEITSQQYLNVSRSVETSQSSSVNTYSNKSPNTSNDISAEEETPTQKREQRKNKKTVAKQLQQLQSRDREVRSHEAAHAAVGGKYVSGGPSFTYQRGPNGRFYAIGGEVQIDVSPVASSPQATLEKAEVVRRAALAPAQPSSKDLRVASNAAKLASRARVEIAIQQRELQQVKAEEKASKETGETNASDIKTDSVSTGVSSYGSSSLAAPADEVFDIIA